jgi:hypothetical protein
VGALVRTWVVDEAGNESEPLSTLVDGYGYWSLNLSLESCEGAKLNLQAIGQRGSEAELTYSACDVKPVPKIVLQEGVSVPGDKILVYLPVIAR